jgi:hypothetical protein
MAGSAGLPGLDGTDGKNGLDGTDGADGANGTDGKDAPPPVDVGALISAALEEKTGGEGGPWTVAVSGLDLNNDAAVVKLFRGVGSIEGDDLIALDLSGCTGWGFCYNPGILPADKARIISIVFPESLTEITDGISGAGAFTGFSALKSVSGSELVYVGNYAFNGLLLETLDLPELTGIGDFAFAASSDAPNTATTTVDFPKVETIGANAFRYYTALETIKLPKVTSIGNYAFSPPAAASSNTKLTELDLPEVKTIGNYAFQFYKALETISLPKVVSIGNYAFAASTSGNVNAALETVDLPEVKTIGDHAFRYYTAIKSISLPKVTSIGTYAFAAPTAASSNTTLTTLELTNVETIGANAFQFNKALATISLPKVVSIGASAFAAASGNANTVLTTLELTTVTSIGNQAFAYCTGLTSLKLGPTVPSLPNLTTPAAAQGIFLQTGSSGGITIYVPTDQQNDYDDAGWKNSTQNDNTTSGIIKFGTQHKAITISTY